MTASLQNDGDESCPAEPTILDYLAGRLSERDEGAVIAHLDACSACRVFVGEVARESRDGAPRARAGEAPRTLREGETVLARYLIESFVARGGMGEVYRARDQLLGEVVALKTLTCTDLDDAGATERLKREVTISRRVTHPNVCRILEFGVHERAGESIPFMTMEMLTGETLGQLIARTGALPEGRVRELLTQVLDGLEAIHAAGIVHRDLKGDNVFLAAATEEPPRAVVMDFGLARRVKREADARSSSALSGAGTADYMAPEQVLGQRETVASDVYSLGVTLFEMLTGRLPFEGTTPVEAAGRRLVEPPPTVSSVAPGLAPVWDVVVGKCLSREPADRYRTVDELRTALTSAVTTHEPPRPSAPRGRIGWIAIAATAAAAAGATWLVTTSRRPAPVPAAVGAPAPVVVPAPVPPPPDPPAAIAPAAPLSPTLKPARKPKPRATVRPRPERGSDDELMEPGGP